MAKLIIKAKTDDLKHAASKGGELLLNNKQVAEFSDPRFDGGMGVQTTAATRFSTKIEVKAGTATFTLKVGAKTWEASADVTESSKKVIVTVSRAGIIGALLGKPYSLKVKVK